MNLWQVERLRIWRTRSVWILFGVFVFFGVLGPLTARFLPAIVERAGASGELTLPPPSPELAMSQYVGNAIQLGILAVAFVAAASLAFDAKTEIAVFYRTRVSVRAILAPRYTVVATTSVAAFVAGTAIAYAVSSVLIGSPDTQATLAGSALIAVYLVFAVALVGLMSSLVASVPGAALLSVGTLIALGIASLIPSVGPWLPSYLVGGFDALNAGGEFAYWRATVVSVVASVAAITASIYLLQRREI